MKSKTPNGFLVSAILLICVVMFAYTYNAGKLTPGTQVAQLNKSRSHYSFTPSKDSVVRVYPKKYKSAYGDSIGKIVVLKNDVVTRVTYPAK